MDRYKDRHRYFQELYETSRSFFIDYVGEFKRIEGSRTLEIGCGEGGNLLAFRERGAEVVGIDLSEGKIRNARTFFSERGAEGRFACGNLLDWPEPSESGKFDIILIHDVIEHIEAPDKDPFFKKTVSFLKKDGIIFWGFPAWQMPFGGHQQICRKDAARLPFIHLLPARIYKSYLKLLGVESHTVDELLSIKRSGMTVERFERLCEENSLTVLDRTLWLVNPHYKVKFGLRPRKLWSSLVRIPWLRNFFSTSCFYITSF